MKLRTKVIAYLSVLLLAACAPEDQASNSDVISGPDYNITYDLLISGGTIVDGTGDPAFMADILVSGDEIAYIGETDASNINALETIDATGRIVSPGFIDAHAHGDPLQENNDHLRSFLRQGVTTVMLGQDGGNPGYDDAVSFEDFLYEIDRQKSGPNVATLVGHGAIRYLSGGGEKDKITPEEQATMEELLEKAMKAGAYGLGTGLEYVPGRYADDEEMCGRAKVVGAHDGGISSHVRNEDDDKVHESIAELIRQGQYARVNASHVKVVYGKTREQGEAVLRQIREARANGVKITADVYPYLASFGDMSYLYPEWAKREFEFNDGLVAN